MDIIPDDRSTWEHIRCDTCGAPAVHCQEVPVRRNRQYCVEIRVTAECGNVFANGEWGADDDHYYGDCCEWLVGSLQRILHCEASDVLTKVKNLVGFQTSAIAGAKALAEE